MNVGLVTNTFSSITNGNSALEGARESSKSAQFSELIDRLKAEEEKKSTLSSSQVSQSGRLNGEYTSGFGGAYTSAADKNAAPQGAAANQAHPHVKQTTIDKTSVLYEKSMELEGYFIKQMLSAMRKTVVKSTENDFARNMYEDMLFDEYATSMTKNAGFGLADQIYMSLV